VIEVQPAAPQQYVVQPGDTLWDIATGFLADPWFWPEIWHVNPQVENPHLIYPGDVLTLYFVGGRPFVTVTGGPRVPTLETERLSPQVRGTPLDLSEAFLPVETIASFLIRPRVISEEAYEQAPYILDSQDERLIFGAGDRVYVRGMEEPQVGQRYSVFRRGDTLRDPESGDVLGYEAIHISEADVTRTGDPATVVLTASVREAFRGDRLLPLDAADADRSFVPHAPGFDADGQVISLFDALFQVGTNQVAVIDIGEQDGIEKGHVLAVHQAGRTVVDRIGGGRDRVTLPDERSGLLLVFRTFDKVSYGLVMDATRTIRLGDSVTSPSP
jgi:hypothetical protein